MIKKKLSLNHLAACNNLTEFIYENIDKKIYVCGCACNSLGKSL